MAKCNVRLKGYKSNKAAYVEIMDSGAVQALCEAPARAIAAECNATFTKGTGELGTGYRVFKSRGKRANYRGVATGTPHAYSSELIHNRLKSALDSRKQ